MDSWVSEMADSMVMHVLRLLQQSLEPFQLDALGGQPPLDIVIGLADIILSGVAPRLVAQRSGLVQKGAVLIRRNPNGVLAQR